MLYALKPQQIFRLLYNYPELRQSLIPIQILNRLRTIPFFAEMTPTILGFLAESCIPISIAGGTSIYSNNDSAEYIYVVDKGQVRLKYPDGQQLWLGNSQPFPAMWAPPPICSICQTRMTLITPQILAVPPRSLAGFAQNLSKSQDKAPSGWAKGAR